MHYCLDSRVHFSIILNRNKLTILAGTMAAVSSLYTVGWYIPKYAINNMLPKALGITQLDDWKLECHGADALKKFDNPLEHCLKATRTPTKPNVIYLLGDSHAAQLYWMVEDAVKDSKYEFKFINVESLTDLPHSFISGEKAYKYSKVLDYIFREARANDYVVVAFHRGYLNEDRDTHIELKENIKINKKTNNFVSNMSWVIGEMGKRGIKVILVRDTPLMQVVSTSPGCALQIKLFGESMCRVSRIQDTHTRFRQDYAFDTLRRSFSNVRIWDPQPIIYGNHDWLDVVDGDGNYIMYDWNHITKFQSKLMSNNFKQELNSIDAEPDMSPKN